MDDRRLETPLRELPRARAGADFTARVLARLDEPPRRRPPHPIPLGRLAMAGLAATAALVVALAAGPLRPGAGEGAQRRLRAAEARRLLEELRREHRALASELDALAEEEPVLYVGGDEEVDLVLDLSRVPVLPVSPGAGAAALAGRRTGGG
jgi:hypothetical protein